MEKETIVQFVWLESGSDNIEFMSQWDEYSKEIRNVQTIKLHQEIAKKKGVTRYLSQHSCVKDNFQFVFKKGRRSAHVPEEEMKVRQLGGYTATQIQCKKDPAKDESKIFVFVTGHENSIDTFQNFSHYRFLNIYEAYFESSNYSYILEYFVENVNTEQFMEQLKLLNRHFESGIYKECVLEAV